jgi:hypothetical protein
MTSGGRMARNMNKNGVLVSAMHRYPTNRELALIYDRVNSLCFDSLQGSELSVHMWS